MLNKRVRKKGKKSQTFDIKPFKLDIDDLIEEFAKVSIHLEGIFFVIKIYLIHRVEPFYKFYVAFY